MRLRRVRASGSGEQLQAHQRATPLLPKLVAGHPPLDTRRPRHLNEMPGSRVEMGGIEPPSDGRPRVILRAQSAKHFSAPGAVQTRHPDGLSQLSVGADPLTRSAPSGSLNDASIRAGSTTRADGLKAQAAIRQRERSRCDCVRHLLVCTHRSRAERASSTRFPSIDDRRRNRSSPVYFIMFRRGMSPRRISQSTGPALVDQEAPGLRGAPTANAVSAPLASCSGASRVRPRACPEPRAAPDACPTPACREPGRPRP